MGSTRTSSSPISGNVISFRCNVTGVGSRRDPSSRTQASVVIMAMFVHSDYEMQSYLARHAQASTRHGGGAEIQFEQSISNTRTQLEAWFASSKKNHRGKIEHGRLAA